MRRLATRLLRSGPVLAGAATMGWAAPGGTTGDMAVPLGAAGREFAKRWCLDCHDSASREGGLDLEALLAGSQRADAARWERVHDRVAAGEMPPPKKSPPPEAARNAFLGELAGELAAADARNRGTVLRRLNRSEYQNTVADLLGVRVDVRETLPADALSHGFDNIGDALGMSEVQLRQYLAAAEAVLDTLFLAKAAPPRMDRTFNFERVRGFPNASAALKKRPPWLFLPDGGVVFFQPAGYPRMGLPEFRAPADGTYRIAIKAFAYQTETVQFALGASGSRRSEGYGTPVGVFEFSATPSVQTREIALSKGDQLTFSPRLEGTRGLLQNGGVENYPGPGVGISEVRVEGPLDAEGPPRGQRLLFGDLVAKAKLRRGVLDVSPQNPALDSARGLKAFASAAFRRPADDVEMLPYVALFRREFDAGASFADAMRTAAAAILCAPQFLYLVEPAGRLDGHAVAARLSYFLWRTAPDEPLRSLAASGALLQPATLRAEVERLLDDPRSERFVADFTDGWLNLRDINATTPDRKLYPEFDGILQESMVAETRGFIHELIRGNLSPNLVIKADFAMLNSRLAEFYGLPPVSGLEIRRVALPPGSRRGGLLTQAAVLKVTANGSNTSPVLRGVYVLDRILGQPPQPPPPGIPGLEPDTRGASTMRELLEKHREMPSCRGCHNAIDPPGFALENYDVIGGWRDRFRTAGEGERVRGARWVSYRLGAPVDASGTLPDGRSFRDYQEFQERLLENPRPVWRTLTEKLLTFATGREMGFSDRADLDAIVDQLAARDGGLRDLVHLIVQSPVFLSK